MEPADFARLLELSRHGSESALDATNVHPHMADCADCRQQFVELESLDRQLSSLKPTESAVRRADCPSPSAWREIAGGLTPLDQTLASIKHASRCDYCGPLLRAALAELADLNGEVTEAERKHIASLESAHPEWQENLARRIAGTPDSKLDREFSPWRQRWLSFPRLAAAGVSLAIVVSAGVWFVGQQRQPAAANQLLAKAYTQRRTLEPRIAGADYAPLRVSRGPDASFTSRPPALLKAESLIASQLQSHPSDPAWLQAKAQADVLEGRYDAAVESLRRALELAPHSSGLLIDLATAYSQRAQQEDRKEDFGSAYEYLSEALKLHPDDPVALFNRAIVSEHEFLYHQALDDWEHYLRLDPGSQWAGEARNHADAVKEKLKEHESEARPLLSPGEIAAKISEASLPSEVDPRIEDYLHEAILTWLPQAFPEGGALGTRPGADPQAAQAVFFLADLTSQQHGDHWLADLLRASSGPHFSRAVTALARAVGANDTGDYDVARQQAHLAERLFRASVNIAGALRAQFEQSFADQMSRHSESCRRRAILGEAESRRYSYPWVEIQLGLERSACSALMGDLGTREEAARRAQERAQQAGYYALSLRALGFVAESKFDTGDRQNDAKLISAGLEHYWSGGFPAVRGYNLYVEEALAAETSQPDLQLAVWREAVAVIDGGENLQLRAEAHSRMANAASAADRPEVAEHNYQEAARLYALAPQSEATRANRLVSEIMTAHLEAGQGGFEAALVRLTGVQDEVRQLSNNLPAQIFYSTLGEVELRSGHTPEAEQAFRAALGLAEQDLASLTSEASRISWSENAAPVYLGLAEAELVQGREQESLDTFEWYLGAPQRVRGHGPSAPQSPSRVFDRLPLLTGQTVLAFGALPDGLAIWAYDNRGISAKWIPQSPHGLRDQVANFYSQCSAPSSEVSALRRNARRLYAALIAPIEEDLAPGRTLVIEAEGWLARVPFEALLDENDRYLIERAPIVHSLGQDSQMWLHSEAGVSADSPALVVASTASSLADGLIPLPDVAAEADGVAGRFHHARVLKGGEATLGAIRSDLPGAAVFHFAGHALDAPQRTGLLLESGSGKANASRLMDATAVRQLDLQSLQLAVLSACSTAAASGGSSGFDSVTDALLRAGVPHVVASRWAVDSVETRGFVEDFYRSALGGQTISDAIRLTSQRMLANPRTSHPYYWSAFAAYGRP